MAKVVFFPKPGSIPVEVCPVRYGKSMLYTQDTDTIATNADLCEFLAFKNNVGATAFINSVNSQNTTTAQAFTTSGRIDLGIYFPTDRWVNPVSGLYELIPDYLATAWTAAGEAAFENAVQGQPKSQRYPNHGQQMYDVSDGAFGIDLTTGVIGGSDLSEFIGVCDHEQQYVGGIKGKSVAAFSYRNGRNDSPLIYTQRFLGGRNSNSSTSGDSYTGYGDSGLPLGIDRVEQVNRPSSMRWWDFWHSLAGGTMQDADDYLAQEFAKTEVNNGWFNDFTHWHTMTDHAHYFDLVGGLLTTHNAYSCPYDEAIKYLFLKSLVKRITAKEVEGTVKVFAEIRDIFDTDVDGLNLATIINMLDVPISISIDLSSTSLAGKDVSCNTGGCIKSGDHLIFELPLSNLREGVLSATISETDSPEYIDLSPISISETSSVVTTNRPCRVIAWNASNAVIMRSDSFRLTTTISGTGIVYIGAIDERGQSSVIEI